MKFWPSLLFLLQSLYQNLISRLERRFSFNDMTCFLHFKWRNSWLCTNLLFFFISGSSNLRRSCDPQEPVSILSNKFAKRVTPDCFHALLSLIKWSWNAFKAGLCELMTECDYDDESSHAVISDLQRLIYVCRACLR